MFQRMYQKVAVQILLLIIVIYGLIKLFHRNHGEQLYMFTGQFYYKDKHQPNLPSEVFKDSNELWQGLKSEYDLSDKQRSNSTSEKVQDNDEKQPNLLHREINHNDKQQLILPPEFDWHLVNLSDNQPKFNQYTETLSAFQTEDLVRQMGISNLTSVKARKQFLQCTGIFLLRELKGKQSKSPLRIPPSSQHCKHMSFKTSGPIVALSSFPGSGNSWVRQLLESTTGIYTGSVYYDPAYVKVGMIGENIRTNNVLVVKMHGLPSHVKRVLHNNKAIYIVRNPFGVILAEHNRNTVRIFKKLHKNSTAGNTHLIEVNFNYGMCVCMLCYMHKLCIQHS